MTNSSSVLEVIRSTARRNQPAPNPADILEQAAALGFKTPSPELLQDLCNIAAQGIVHDDVQIEDTLREARRKQLSIFSLVRYGLARDPVFPKALMWNQAMAELLRQIKPKEVPGRTDEERAMSLASLSGSVEEELQDGKSPKQIADTLSESFDQVSELDQAELDLLGGLPHPVGTLAPQPKTDDEAEMIDEDDGEIDRSDFEIGTAGNEQRIREGSLNYFVPDPACPEYDRLTHSLRQTEIARRLMEDHNLGRLIHVARILRDFSRLNVRRTVRELPDREGPDLRVREMKSLAELPKIPVQEWALRQRAPLTFLAKLASQGMMIRERTRRETRKQLLYALLDCSASMKMGDSRYKLGGVVMNRLTAVTKGDAVLLYRFFGVKLYEEHRVSTPAESRYALRHVMSCTFPDEETRLSPAIRGTLRRIKQVRKDENLERPHLLVVTDGSVSSNITAEELGDVVLHLVLIDAGGNYENLMNLAKLSGGVVIEKF